MARKYGPYFDQGPPDRPVIGLVASVDKSPPYEMDAAAVFACDNGFLAVHVSGCSCWPDRGYTEQQWCEDRVEVQRAIREFSIGYASDVLEACEAAKWEVMNG